MLVLLHRRHPGHVVERHHPQSKVRVIRDLVDFLDEGLQGGCGDAVDSGDKVRRREAVLVGGRAAHARRDVDFGVEFGDLLADGVVGAVEDGAAEDEGAGSVEVGGGDGGDVEFDFAAGADDERFDARGRVHDVELRDAGDEFIVECEDDVTFLEALAVGPG